MFGVTWLHQRRQYLSCFQCMHVPTIVNGPLHASETRDHFPHQSYYLWLTNSYRIISRGKYTLPTCSLAHLHFAYLWFQTWHFAHLRYYFLTSVTYPLTTVNVNKIKTKENKNSLLSSSLSRSIKPKQPFKCCVKITSFS